MLNAKETRIDRRFKNNLSRHLTMAIMALCALGLMASPVSAAEPEGLDALNTSSATRTPKSGTKATRDRPTRVRSDGKRTRVRRSSRRSRKEGAYFSGGIGLVNPLDAPAGLELNSGGGLTLGLGYRLNANLALEGNFHGSLLGADGNNVDDSRLLGGSAHLKYFFPLNDHRMEAYGMAGLGLMSIEAGNEEVSGTFFDVGGGFDYRLSRETSLGAKASFNRLFGEDGNGSDANMNSFTIMGTVTFRL